MTTQGSVKANSPPLSPYWEGYGCAIYHCDSFEAIEQLGQFGAVVTDPPYSSGGQYRSQRTRSTTAKYVHSKTLAYRPEFGGDHFDQRSWMIWTEAWLRAVKAASAPEALLCSFIDWRQLPALTDVVQFAGWTWRGVAVWTKGYGRVMPSGFSSAAEYVVVASNGSMPKSESYPPGAFDYRSSGKDKRHTAQKPDPVMDWVVSAIPSGTRVIDPFLGVGSTMVACAKAALPCVGVEVEERYCEEAARRMEEAFS